MSNSLPVIVAGILAAMIVVSTAHAKPNVLLIMTDDQGYGDINAHNNPAIHTPTLNALAKQSATFDRFFVSPVCAPTRASLLTGRYHTRCNVAGVTRGWENMRTEEITLAEVFKANGYSTAAFGKWHNGRHYPMHPNGQGFDTFIGFCGGHWNNYFDTNLEHNRKPIQRKGYITDVITDEAIKFITNESFKALRKPWFCYVPYNAPHSPWEVPNKYWNKYKALAKANGWDDKATCAFAMVEAIDDNIARLLKTLDDHQLAGDTIVLFLTDNGPNSDRYNGGMRGRKGSVHEGGVRVPLFVRWPGKIQAGKVIKPIAAHIDVLPTLVDLCELKKPDGPKVDGVSLKPLLLAKSSERGLESDWPDRKLFTLRYWADKPLAQLRGAVRTQRWRATFERNRWSLYDMQDDPGQKKDVAKANSELVKQFAESFDTFKNDVGVGKLQYIPTPIGHPKSDVAELPGSEVFLTPTNKGIWYSGQGNNGYANAWIKQWTDAKAFAHWEVEVLQAGRYEVSLQYKCKKEDVGSTIRVSVGDQHVDATITKAHEATPHKSHDRVAASENYVNWNWATMKLGALELKTGRSKLKLQAIEKAGKEVGDIKALWVTRIRE